MDLNEKAKEYAEKVLKMQINRISQAYIDGYNDALQEVLHLPVEEDGIKYYDMSLPSGTMWSAYIKDEKGFIETTYNRVKDLSIPTLEDVAELKKYTKGQKSPFDEDITYLSEDGEMLHFTEYKSFWIKKEDAESQDAYAADNDLSCYPIFKGFSKRLILVKRKK